MPFDNKNKNLLTQEEINTLKREFNENLSLEDSIKNIIILSRNELNILEEELFESDLEVPINSKEKIKENLSDIFSSLIEVRKY